MSKAIDKARDDSADGLRVGAWLRAQREARGMKQKDVAALWPSATGGLTGCVANWETLGKVPKWDQWQMLKAFIGFGDEMDAEVWRLNGRKGQPGGAWAEREVVGRSDNGIAGGSGKHAGQSDAYGFGASFDITAPATDAARQWQGWGTALKPALEPITVARKPLSGTVAANVLAHGTGALNIDGCRIGDKVETWPASRGGNTGRSMAGGEMRSAETGAAPAGRWPANLIHDGSEEVVASFPAAGGAQAPVTRRGADSDRVTFGAFGGGEAASDQRDGGGSAARFFYCAKASRADRNDGCEAMDKKPLNWSSGTQSPGTFQAEGTDRSAHNNHPTVKPTDLMRYLCRLVTPPGGLVLDPFAGSGSTGRGAILEGFRFLGIEREAEYVEIARARISAVMPKPEAPKPQSPQLSMFDEAVA